MEPNISEFIDLYWRWRQRITWLCDCNAFQCEL